MSWGQDPSVFDEAAVASTLRASGALFGDRRYFRVTMKGVERIPEAPAMIVMNHSGGTTLVDAFGFGYSWYRHFGTGRPIHPAAHEFVIGNRYTGPYFARRGIVRADREIARRILSEHREDLLVMPGGDLDVWRPFKDRYQVRFAGRTGYARLALEAGVPVVPVAHAGAHETLVVLSDGRRFAEAVGLPRIARAHVWPVHLSLPWGLAVGPLPHLPLPARFRYRIGEPVWPSDVGVSPGEVVSDEQVRAFDRRVRGVMQGGLDALREESR